MLALRKQLKELGFEEEVIKTVLLQESTGQVTLDQAIDLCLSHNEFQVALFLLLLSLHALRTDLSSTQIG